MTNGKGSTRRPAQVPDNVLAENWRRTFGRAITEIEAAHGIVVRANRCSCGPGELCAECGGPAVVSAGEADAPPAVGEQVGRQ